MILSSSSAGKREADVFALRSVVARLISRVGKPFEGAKEESERERNLIGRGRGFSEAKQTNARPGSFRRNAGHRETDLLNGFCFD